MSEESDSRVRRFLDLFRADSEPEYHEAPDRCPHCSLRVSEVRIVNDKTGQKRGRWACYHCGNAPEKEPEWTPEEAHERFQKQLEKQERFLESVMDDA